MILKYQGGIEYVYCLSTYIGTLTYTINYSIYDEKYDPARTRTWNPLIRSQMPYPLGHRAAVGPT